MTREDIVNAMSIEEAIQVFKDTNCYGTMDIAKTVILKTLEQEIKTEWIPVSERLPEEIGTYITTVDYGIHGLATGQRYYHGKGIGWEDDCVIAWMPLPEPYKE